MLELLCMWGSVKALPGTVYLFIYFDTCILPRSLLWSLCHWQFWQACVHNVRVSVGVCTSHPSQNHPSQECSLEKREQEQRNWLHTWQTKVENVIMIGKKVEAWKIFEAKKRGKVGEWGHSLSLLRECQGFHIKVASVTASFCWHVQKMLQQRKHFNLKSAFIKQVICYFTCS